MSKTKNKTPVASGKSLNVVTTAKKGKVPSKKAKVVEPAAPPKNTDDSEVIYAINIIIITDIITIDIG